MYKLNNLQLKYVQIKKKRKVQTTKNPLNDLFVLYLFLTNRNIF